MFRTELTKRNERRFLCPMRFPKNLAVLTILKRNKLIFSLQEVMTEQIPRNFMLREYFLECRDSFHLKLLRSELQNLAVEMLAPVAPIWVGPGSSPGIHLQTTPAKEPLGWDFTIAASYNSLCLGSTLSDFMKLRLLLKRWECINPQTRIKFGQNLLIEKVKHYVLRSENVPNQSARREQWTSSRIVPYLNTTCEATVVDFNVIVQLTPYSRDRIWKLIVAQLRNKLETEVHCHVHQRAPMRCRKQNITTHVMVAAKTWSDIHH